MVEEREIQEELRDRAIARLKKKSEFRAHLFVYVVVNAALVAIWAMTGANFFWPVFPMLGWGIGLIFHAWDTYRSEEFSEERIHREIEHLK
jgi:2TM domain